MHSKSNKKRLIGGYNISATINQNKNKSEPVIKITQRKTVIQFEHHKDLVNFCLEYGIKSRLETHEIAYFEPDGTKILFNETRRFAEKHRIPLTKGYNWSTYFESWDTARALERIFGLEDDTVSVTSMTITITTRNYTQASHIKTVRKMYRPLKVRGYDVNRDCETIVTNDKCY